MNKFPPICLILFSLITFKVDAQLIKDSPNQQNVYVDNYEQVMAQWDTPRLKWTPCDNKVINTILNVECSLLAVPIDWTQPSGPLIELNLVRIKAQSSSDYKGAVLALSGGPGGSGIEDMPYVAEALPQLWDNFDLLTHEPRTTLALKTSPTICTNPSGAIMDLPRDSTHYEQILAPLREAVDKCRNAVDNGLLDYLDGLSQALDIEAIRRAVGAKQLNITAQSYGGVIVATYARTFPNRIRTAYLDGVASHPDFPFVHGPKTQQREFERFADWCETNQDCLLFGQDIVQIWKAVVEDANKNPIPARSQRFGEYYLSGAQIQFLTRRWRDPGENYSGWKQLAYDIDLARKGDASPFVDWAIGNLMGWATPISLALQCPDGAEGIVGFKNFQTRMNYYKKERPLFYGIKLLGMTCEAWPLSVANPPAPLPVEKLPPFLGAGTLANDFTSTAQFLDHIPNSITISVPGSGHVIYLGGVTDKAQECVSEHITRYIKELKLPKPNIQCGA